MDRVRFGRALGFGARQAVKTLVTAVDAATAEKPSGRSAGRAANSGLSGEARSDVQPAARAATGASKPARQPATRATPTAKGVPDSAARKAAHTAARAVVQAQETKQGLRRGSKRFGEAVWRPFVRLSGVLWLEVSGVFFGVFALLALGYLWKLRGAWHAGAADASDHRSWMGAVIMLVLFGYFCVSSFVRARRRERRR